MFGLREFAVFFRRYLSYISVCATVLSLFHFGFSATKSASATSANVNCSSLFRKSKRGSHGAALFWQAFGELCDPAERGQPRVCDEQLGPVLQNVRRLLLRDPADPLRERLHSHHVHRGSPGGGQQGAEEAAEAPRVGGGAAVSQPVLLHRAHQQPGH